MGGADSKPLVDLTYPPHPPTKPNGKVVNGYTIQATLGKGAFGKVFRVLRNSDNQLFAMKVQTITNSKILEMIRKEIDTMNNLKSENIVQLFDVFEWQWTKSSSQYSQQVLCIILELVEGPDMAKIFEDIHKQNARLPQDIKARWLIQLCRGVAYIHSQGKIHRDIKPANILIQADTCTLKIADFGLAKELDVDQVTRTKGVGTPMYMAPEMTLSQTYDYKVDVWAVGLILLELFGDAALNPHDVYYNRLQSNWDNLLQHQISTLQLPETQALFVRACLLQDAEKRYKMTDLVQTALFRAYALCFGLVSPSEVDAETQFILSEPDLVYPLSSALDSNHPAAIRWASTLLLELVSNNQAIVQHLMKKKDALSNLAKKMPEVRKLLDAMNGVKVQHSFADLTCSYSPATGTIITGQSVNYYHWMIQNSSTKTWESLPQPIQELLEKFRLTNEDPLKRVWSVIATLNDTLVAFNTQAMKAVFLGSCAEVSLEKRLCRPSKDTTLTLPSKQRRYHVATFNGSEPLPQGVSELLARVAETPSLSGIIVSTNGQPSHCVCIQSPEALSMLDLATGRPAVISVAQ